MASRRWLSVPLALAAAAVVAAMAFDANHWAGVLHHPSRQPMPQATGQGASLWRVMLFVGAAALAAGPLLLALLEARFHRLVPEGAPAPDRHRTGQVGDVSRRHAFLPLFLLVAIGLLARLPRLAESLWYDELAAWGSFGVHGPGVIVGNWFDPANHVAHTLLTWLSVTMMDGVLPHVIAIRLPALLFSLLSILVVHRLAARVGLGRSVSLIAAAVIAMMPVSVLEGVEARGYSMMICFAALTTQALLAAWDDGRAWRWTIYAACAALGAWTHPIFAFVPIGHAIWLLWMIGTRRPDATRTMSALVAMMLAATLALTLYAPILPDMLAMRETFRAARIDQPGPLGAEGRHLLAQLGGSWSGAASVPGVMLLLAGTWSVLRDGRSPVPARLAAAWLGLPVAMLFVILAGTWVYARFLLFAMPAAAVTIALGIERLHRVHRALGVVAALILAAAYAADLASRPPKQPLADAWHFVHEHRDATDQALVIGLAHAIDLALARDMAVDFSFHHGRDVATKLDSRRPQWIVLYYPNSVPTSVYAALCDRGYRQAARFHGWVDWTNGDVLVFRRDDPSQ